MWSFFISFSEIIRHSMMSCFSLQKQIALNLIVNFRNNSCAAAEAIAAVHQLKVSDF